MKKKDQYRKAITTHLAMNGSMTAAEIQRATKVKGNIYTTLAELVKEGYVSKSGKLYDVSGSRETEKPPISYKTWKNSTIDTLKSEHDHVMQGIHQLQITANYLNLRIKELERATQQA